jgi:hypothetical protein
VTRLLWRRLPILLAIAFFVLALKRPLERTVWFVLALVSLLAGLRLRRAERKEG